MKKYIILLLVISSIALLLNTTTMLNDDTEKVSEEKIKGSIPKGYWEYQTNRFKDPKTGKVPPNIRAEELEFARKLKAAQKSQNNYSSSEWISRGPDKVGGRTRAIGIDIRDKNILLAGGVSGGIWKSNDDGNSWNKKTRNDEFQGVSCLVQDTRPGKEDTWYYGTGEYRGLDWLGGNGIYKSSDNGETWFQLESTLRENYSLSRNFDFIFDLRVDQSNFLEDELYAAAFGAIYRSIDGGESWSRVLGGPAIGDAFTEIDITSDGVVYATISTGASKGIWRSVDGEDWVKITPEGLLSSFQRIEIAVAPSNEDIVYFYSEESQDYSQVKHGFFKYTYLTEDGSGANGRWEDRSDKLPPTIQSYMSFCMVLEISPVDENLVLLGGMRLFRSTNGFENSFKTTNLGLDKITPERHVDQHQVLFSYDDPNIVYSANDGGVRKTNNISNFRVNWISLNNGFITTQWTTITMPNVPNDRRIMGGLQDNGTYTLFDNQASSDWTLSMDGDGAYSLFLKNGEILVNSWQFGNTYIAKNPLLNLNPQLRWTRINPTMQSPVFITPMIIDPGDEKIIYLADGLRIQRCDDVFSIPMNNTFNDKNSYWDKIEPFNSRITTMSISKSRTDILFAATQSGEIYRVENCKSKYPTISKIKTSIEMPINGYSNCILADPEDFNHILVCYSGYNIRSMFETKDGGETWVHVTGNLEENENGLGAGPSILWIDILKVDGKNRYFLGTSIGLFSTTELNENTQWILEGPESIGNVIVEMFTVRQSDGEVVVGTYGSGVYSKSFNLVSAEDINNKIAIKLAQNYPNPFNPETNIEYELDQETYTTLKVFDSLGREVARLVNKRQRQGLYKVNFNGNKLPSGIYYYRLTTDKFSATKKMALIR